MSEPTYRVRLIHRPEKESHLEWEAAVFRCADDTFADTFIAESREAAFDKARSWVVRKSLPAEDPSTVYLTEDGDILDPHEVQR